MANFIIEQDRRVIPNWRSFGNTVALGELDTFKQKVPAQDNPFQINEYIIDFNLNKTIVHASELLSAAISNNVLTQEVISAAEFILKNSSKASRLQILLANQILNPEDVQKKYTECNNDDKLLKFFENQNDRIRKKIHDTKKTLQHYSQNPILYVELSRYYSIAGEETKSINAMKIAMHLAQENRFVLRSATRLFVHYHTEEKNYLEYIQRILAKSPFVSYDPWIMSAEISISNMLKRNSKFIKKGVELIASKNYSPFSYTELASNIGTIEMQNGGHKKSRQFFKQSLVAPNDNTLAQIEWASRHDKMLEISLDTYDTKKKFEALTFDTYYKGQFEQTLSHCIHWFFDQPYSKHPALFGSNIAATHVKDQAKAIALVKAGLMSHPNDPALINNYAYSLSLDDRPDEALIELDKIRHSSNVPEETKVCLKATRGLALFRTRIEQNIEEGRKLYKEALEDAKEIKNQNLMCVALLNYSREELLYDQHNAAEVLKLVDLIPKNIIENPAIKYLREEIIQQCTNGIQKIDTKEKSNIILLS